MNITTIKRINKEKGYYFFAPATMRFFDSAVHAPVHEGHGGIFFVTSEQDHFQTDSGNPRQPLRLYTVCRFDPQTGTVHRASAFQQFAAKAAAHYYATRLARNLVNLCARCDRDPCPHPDHPRPCDAFHPKELTQ